MENNEKLRLLIQDVIAKKELSNLDESFVEEKVKRFLDANKKINEKLSASDYNKFRRSKEHKRIIKEVRQGLRSVYGVFILDDYRKREAMLEELKKDPSIDNVDKILALHKSSSERLPYYDETYKKIFEITGKPKKILDLACGLNPISYPYLGCRPHYLACDIATKDLEFIKKYFDTTGIQGDVKKIDLLRDDIKELSVGFDIAFLFKTLDSLETVKRNSSKEILKNLQSKYIVVSFATLSIGGRKEIKKIKRAWFERAIRELGYKVSFFELPGEIFYILGR